jgi:hypothetical protein
MEAILYSCKNEVIGEWELTLGTYKPQFSNIYSVFIIVKKCEIVINVQRGHTNEA